MFRLEYSGIQEVHQKKCGTVKDLCASCEVQEHMLIPVEEVDTATLEKVLEYCTRTKDVEYVPKADDEDQRTLTEQNNRPFEVSNS